MSHNAAVDLIQHVLDENVNITEIYVDTVGSPAKYQQYLSNVFSNYNIKITVCPKADSLYKCVSAASICAKVTRDKILTDYSKSNNDIIIGSGYPGDENTKDYLKSHTHHLFGFKNNSLVRFSWNTTKNILQGDENGKDIENFCCNVEWSENEDEDEQNTQSPQKKFKRNPFFESVGINRCNSLF